MFPRNFWKDIIISNLDRKNFKMAWRTLVNHPLGTCFCLTTHMQIKENISHQERCLNSVKCLFVYHYHFTHTWGGRKHKYFLFGLSCISTMGFQFHVLHFSELIYLHCYFTEFFEMWVGAQIIILKLMEFLMSY